MLIIKPTNNENIERMLKRFKRSFEKTKVLKELRERQQYEKPSVKRRRQIKLAVYKQQKYSNTDNE